MTHEDVLIIGGGMVGRLVQRYVPKALILDWGNPPDNPNELPKQWGAIYWWQPVADYPCRQFTVRTTIDGQTPTRDGILKYKERVGKGVELQTRPSAIEAQFRHESVGFAPEVMPPPTRIQYKAHVTGINLFKQQAYLRDGSVITYRMLVSTIPMPSLFGMVGEDFSHPNAPQFKSAPIYVREYYDPYRDFDCVHVDYRTQGTAYRITHRPDGITHFESTVPEAGAKKIVPGRIYDIPEATGYLAEFEGMNVHCFGRYACWDSDELLHHTDANVADWALEKFGVRLEKPCVNS